MTLSDFLLIAFNLRAAVLAHTHTGEMQGLAYTAFVAAKQGRIPCSTLNIQLKFDVAMVTGKEGHYCPKFLPSTQAISALVLGPHQ